MERGSGIVEEYVVIMFTLFEELFPIKYIYHDNQH